MQEQHRPLSAHRAGGSDFECAVDLQGSPVRTISDPEPGYAFHRSRAEFLALQPLSRVLQPAQAFAGIPAGSGLLVDSDPVLP
jgi:hypothetical protein